MGIASVPMALAADGRALELRIAKAKAAALLAQTTDTDAKNRELRAENERLRELDREAATHVESVIAMRTTFSGEPPYVGWKGLGVALTEALDERDRLKSEEQHRRDEELRAVLQGLTHAVQAAFGAGFAVCAAEWSHRDDLLADIGSPAYLADREKALRPLGLAPQGRSGDPAVSQRCIECDAPVRRAGCDRASCPHRVAALSAVIRSQHEGLRTVEDAERQDYLGRHAEPQTVQDAMALDAWLIQHASLRGGRVRKLAARQSGPHAVRSRERFTAALALLEDAGRVRIVCEGRPWWLEVTRGGTQ